MAQINTYALAVKIDDNLFEIFHLINTEENSDMDTRYQESTKKETKVMALKPNEKFNLGAFWNEEGFILNNEKEPLAFDTNADTYVFLSENIVFGMFKIVNEHPFIEKYRAAIESDVIIVNLSKYNDVSLGDLWNRKELYSIEGFKK